MAGFNVELFSKFSIEIILRKNIIIKNIPKKNVSTSDNVVILFELEDGFFVENKFIFILILCRN